MQVQVAKYLPLLGLHGQILVAKGVQGWFLREAAMPDGAKASQLQEAPATGHQ